MQLTWGYRHCIVDIGSASREAAIINLSLTGDMTMAAKFELKVTANNKYMFNLKAGNGEIILTSQQYKAIAYAKRGIASVKKNANSEIVDQN